MIYKNILLMIFLNDPKLILLHTVESFQVIIAMYH